MLIPLAHRSGLYSEVEWLQKTGRDPAAGLGKGQLTAGSWLLNPLAAGQAAGQRRKHLSANCIPEGPMKLGGRREERPW